MRSAAALSVVIGLCLTARPAAAQENAWDAVLGEPAPSRVFLKSGNISGMLDVPPPCGKILPDSVRLVGGPAEGVSYFTAMPDSSGGGSTLTFVKPPAEPDTMHFALKEARCSALYDAPEVLILERDRRYLIYYAPISPTTTKYQWTYPNLLVNAPDGKPSLVLWDRDTRKLRIERTYAAEQRAAAAAAQAKQRAAAAAAQKAKSAAIARWRAKGWSQRAIDAVVAGKIYLGMNKEMVQESWGSPSDINRTITGAGVHEQWVYGDSYVYFDDGRLTAIQD